jgi:hypothetical protein
MSDDLSGGGGSDGPKVSAEIEFVVKGINQAVAVIKAATAAMEKDVVNFDKTLDAVNASLRIMGAEARTAFQKAKEEAQKATTETVKAKTALTKTQGKNQASRQEHLQWMKDKTAEIKTDDNAHAKYMQNSRTRYQTSQQNFRTNFQLVDQQIKKDTQAHNSKMGSLRLVSQLSRQNHQLTIQENNIDAKQVTQAHQQKIGYIKLAGQLSKQTFQASTQAVAVQAMADTQSHQQKMGAMKGTTQILKQNHQLTMQQLTSAHQKYMGLTGQQNLALKATMQTSKQNHQVTMAQLKLQFQAAKQAAGGGFGGTLAGIGKVAGGLMGKGGGLGAVAGAAVGGLAGGALVQGVSAVTNAIIGGIAAADELSNAYLRQNLAGKTLAGTQEELNELLEVYDKATGEALSKSKQMAGVVRLQAVGFADSKQELEQFAKAIRGISLSIGEPADYVTQNLILELFSQRGQRLDQLGLQYDDVRRRQEELMESDRTMTKQQAYQQAVLDQALDRYGLLAESTEGQASGVEQMAAAWSDFGLALSLVIKGPLDGLIERLAQVLDLVAQVTTGLAKTDPGDTEYPTPVGGLHYGEKGGGTTTRNEAEAAKAAAQAREALLLQYKANTSIMSSMSKTIEAALGISDGLEEARDTIRKANRTLAVINVIEQRRSGYKDPTPGSGTYDDQPKKNILSDDQEAEVRSFSLARRNIEAETNAAILEENQEYSDRRKDIERDYQQQVAEEAEDFARKRARDEAEFAKDIAKAQADSAEQIAEIWEDLGKSIAKANRDHAQDIEKWERDHGLRIKDLKEDAADDIEEVDEDLAEKQEDAKKDSAEKLTEMEEEFGRDRAKAAKAHNESILQAASHLDAAAIFWEQKKFAREEKEAQEALDLKIAKEKEGLQEELTENEKAAEKRKTEITENLAEQIAEENAAHELRLSDANAAHAQQLEDQKVAAQERADETAAEDLERLNEMKQAHIDRMTEEDIDRGIRLQRDFTHHNNQLLELDRVHGLRMTQINTQAQAERDKLDEEHRQKMLDLGFQNGQWMEADRRARNIALKEHELFLKKDAYLDIEARKAAMSLKRNDPSTSPEEVARLDASIGYLNNELIALGPLIDALETAIPLMPQPQTDLLPSSPDAPATTSGLVNAAGVDMGVWTGKTAEAPMISGMGNTLQSGAVSIKVEEGAIVINASAGQSVSALGEEFESRLLTVLKKVAKVA